jgi:2-dehydro-3-deoxyphosphogluconate aldolase / (4S)-4-hydroxy-2-oxoglutarate aldolase
MEKSQVIARIQQGGLIPILRTPSADEAMVVAEALAEAGLTSLEIPLTVPGAIEVIAELSKRWGDEVLVGAGTVLDATAAESCIAAGATFIISPSSEMEVIDHCVERGVAVFPGALTPTEIVDAWRAGADMIKVFPCSAMGGASYISAVRAPLPHIPLVPTGGVSLQTAAAFIKAGASALGVGSELVDLDAIREGRAQVIGERARLYLEIVQETRAGR